MRARSRVRRRRAARVVRVYTRRGCGLCATAEVLAVREAGRATVELVDVDADPALQRAYNLLVPVVEVDGVVVAETILEPGVVRAALRASRPVG